MLTAAKTACTYCKQIPMENRETNFHPNNIFKKRLFRYKKPSTDVFVNGVYATEYGLRMYQSKRLNNIFRRATHKFFHIYCKA